MLHAYETSVKPSRSMLTKIRNFAHFGGGIHRMNTAGATLYSFTAYTNNKTGEQDWSGGWDWSSTVTESFEWVLDMSTNKISTTKTYLSLRKHMENRK